MIAALPIARFRRRCAPQLASQQHRPPLAGLCLLPATQQQVEFFVAADERCLLRAQCLETAQDAACTDHAPGALGLGKTGERLRPEILDLEQPTNLPSGAGGNDE